VVLVLKKFSKVKTVTRDFSLTFKNTINEALPNAKHIVDRFHIFKNLTDDLNEYLKRTIKDTVKIIENNDDNEIVLNKRQKDKVETSKRKWEVILEVQKLKNEGYNNSEIERKMELSRMTVIKYLKLKEAPIRSDDSILDNYVPLIKKYIIEGKKN